MNLREILDARLKSPSWIRAVYFELVLRSRRIMKFFRDATVTFLGRKKSHLGPWWLQSDMSIFHIFNDEKNVRVVPFALSCFLFQDSFACAIRCSLWCMASRSLCSLWEACNERRWYQPYTTPANRAVYRTTWELSDIGILTFEDIKHTLTVEETMTVKVN